MRRPPQKPPSSACAPCHKMACRSSSRRPPVRLPLLLPLLLFLFACPAAASASLASQKAGSVGGGGNVTEAAAWTPRLRKTFLDGGVEQWRGRRLVGRFQVCAVCTCCGGRTGCASRRRAATPSTVTSPTAPSASAPSPRAPATASTATSSLGEVPPQHPVCTGVGDD
ncbi:hypothetical protein U9M48_003268 [Paspalum notatum var. saurae]|uniref:Uncharacterized protein n=1 Tax=Paspalum notatum var. saurae TaxID=547442 RepID=A0AAQ3PIA8_PASNO